MNFPERGLLRASSCLVLAGILAALTLVFSAQWDRKGAEQALELARRLRVELAQSANPSKEDYLRCIRTYKRVFAKDPHYNGCDDAIYEAGQLCQEMGERFGDLEYCRQAVKYFRFLVSDYGGSRFCPDALLRIAELYSGPLEDQSAAGAAHQQLLKQYPNFKAVAPLAAKREEKATPEKKAGEEQATKNAVVSPTPEVSSGIPADVTPAAVPQEARAGRAVLQSIRHWTTSDYTRVIIDMDREAQYKKTRLQHPDRIYFDISNAWVGKNLHAKALPVGDDFLTQVRVAQNQFNIVRVVLDVQAMEQCAVSELHDPFRIVIDLQGKRTSTAQSAVRGPASMPKPDEIPAASKKQSPASDQGVQREPLGRPVQRQVAEPPHESTPGRPAAAKISEGKAQPTPSMREPVRSPPAEPGQAQPKTGETKNIASSETRNRPPSSNAGSVETPKSGPEPKEVSTASQPKPSETKSLQPDTRTQTSVGTPGPTETPKPAPEQPRDTAAALQPKSGEAKNLLSETRTRPGPVDIPKPALPTSRGDRTLTRMLGLKIGRIVIDPGHGGHDTGTIGPGGLMEKELVLEIAKDLERLLQQKLGGQVFLTREDDTFISLEERTAIANQHQADLFISIHANSSTVRSTSGVETYYLDFAKTAAEREVAARENAATSQNVRDLEELIKRIVQADKSKESRELAALVQKKLFADAQRLFPTSHNRGVRRAPFVVLIGANMPSVLAEVGFISNPRDEKLLKKQDTRLRLAQALFAAIEGYVKALGSYVGQY